MLVSPPLGSANAGHSQGTRDSSTHIWMMLEMMTDLTASIVTSCRQHRCKWHVKSNKAQEKSGQTFVTAMGGSCNFPSALTSAMLLSPPKRLHQSQLALATVLGRDTLACALRRDKSLPNAHFLRTLASACSDMRCACATVQACVKPMH